MEQYGDSAGPWHCGALQTCPRCLFANLLASVLVSRSRERLVRRLIRAPSSLNTGQTLRREGEPFQALYMLRAGVLKTFVVSEDGAEQIIDFHFPGELVGLSAMGTGNHLGCTMALSPSAVCVIRASDMDAVCREYPDVQKRLLQLTSREVARRERMHQLMSGTRAECRLAMALLNIAERLGVTASRGELRFQLPMARVELAAYLGLTAETASRQLRRWEDRNWIRTRGREFTIRVPPALRALAGRHSAAEAHRQVVNAGCQYMS